MINTTIKGKIERIKTDKDIVKEKREANKKTFRDFVRKRKR